MEVEMHIGRLVTLAILLGSVHSAAMADIVENKSGQTIALPDTLGDGVNILAGARSSDDCDDIRLIASPMSGASLPTVRLRTDTDVGTKRVELFVDGISVAILEAPGSGGTSPPAGIRSENLYKTQLNLIKPKMLGVMTGLYQIVGLSRFAHHNLEIFWAQDQC